MRPGKGYEPAFELAARVDVNGANAHPLFEFLRFEFPYPLDRTPEKDAREPYGIMKRTVLSSNTPRTPSDIQWNFEKFLIDREGNVVERFITDLTPENPIVIGAIEQALG